MLHANTWTQRLLAKLSFTEMTYSLMFFVHQDGQDLFGQKSSKTDFIIIITQVFSISWSFRNNLNMLICCSRNSSNDQLWKPLWCLIYLWKVLQMYINTFRPKIINVFTVTVDQHQCWASYSNNIIYYSLLVTPFKSNIVTLLITFWQQ